MDGIIQHGNTLIFQIPKKMAQLDKSVLFDDILKCLDRIQNEGTSKGIYS